MKMETVVFGKCILAGEHAVLRGVPALVFPVFARSLELKFEDAPGEVTLDLKGEHGQDMRLLFWGVIEKALQMTGHSTSEMSGHFEVTNSIPVGAGMGASAALCVALGRWFHWKAWTPEDTLSEFCRQLENLFHGESSGVDIAVAISGRGIHYERGGDRYAVDPMWKPHWYVSYSGQRGITSECVAKVKELWKTDEVFAASIDAEMREASQLSEKALTVASREDGFEMLIHAINKARDCFDKWGLTDGPIGDHLEMLSEAGAVAVKPTGSGGGGFVLSLWREHPPKSISDRLISLNR